MAKKNKEIIENDGVQGQEELLTDKEARSEIARVFLDKRKKVNKEIEKVQHDETMTEEEKKAKIDELKENLYL